MDKESSKKKLKIGNCIFYIYIVYMLFVVFTEWINFIYWIVSNQKLRFGIAEMTACSFLVIIMFITRKKIEIQKINFNFELVFGSLIILILGVLISAYPDGGFDTFNYHLIAQNPNYENYFVEDFGYGNFQVWGFRLGDRMFYYFRYLFGFRLGTYLNTLVFVVAFIQIYQIISKLYEKTFPDERSLVDKLIYNKLLWSLAILFPLDSIMMYGTYYVDAIAIPIGFEVIRLIIEDHNLKIKTQHIVYFAALNGLWISIKLTNVVYVIPCIIVYLILHYKSFKMRHWMTAILIGLFPFVEYLLYNWLCTGNPVFPYYNSIFKSPYYPEMNWKDLRWGGTNLWEKLFWLWSAAFKPEYRQSEIWDEWNGVLIIGLIGSMILVLGGIIQKIRKTHKSSAQYCIFFTIAVLSGILWSFTTGISRYYIIGRLLWGGLAFCFVLTAKVYLRHIGKLLGAVCLITATTCTAMNMTAALNGRNWSFHTWTIDTFKEQMKFVYFDNDIKNNYKQDIDMFILTNNMGMGVAELIDNDAYSINTNYYGMVSWDSYAERIHIPMEQINNTSSDTRSFIAQKFIENKISTSNKVYDLHSRTLGDIHEYVDILNKNYVYVTDMKPIEISIGTYEMVSLEKLVDRKNTVWTSNSGEYIYDISEYSGRKSLSFIGGRIFDWPVEQVCLVISLSDGKTERTEATILLDNSYIHKYEIPLDILDGDVVIKIVPYYFNSGEVMNAADINCAFGMNIVIQ